MIYEECLKRMHTGEEFNPDLLAQTVNVIKVMIIYHHTLIEEQDIFPRFIEADIHVEMAKILTEQHDRVEELQETILQYSNPQNDEEKAILIDAMKKSIRVFRPHIDREDTEMFSDFKDVVTVHEYYELGEKVHNMVIQKWGPRGYNELLDKIIHVETALGINDLASFTPKI